MSSCVFLVIFVHALSRVDNSASASQITYSDTTGLTATASTSVVVPATLPATDAAVTVTLAATGGDGTSTTNIAVDVTEAPTDADTTGSTVVPGSAELIPGAGMTTMAPEAGATTTVAATTPKATTTVSPGEPEPSPGSKYGVNEAFMVVGALFAMIFI